MEDCIFKFSMEHDKEKLLMKYPNVIILRTSWLYGPEGKILMT